ncbi:MAG: hypothetical protein KF788_18205 [Piscinibacter sp.]|nr:hypothetical protein [Piscinibacter sp.]
MSLLGVLGLKPAKNAPSSTVATTRSTATAQAGAGDAPSTRNDTVVDPDAPPQAPVDTGKPATVPPTVSADAGADQPPVAGKGGVGGKEVTDYADERKAVKALVDALSAHAQASHLSAELAEIATKMASANANATTAKWKAAMADLAEAKKLCAKAKTLADNWDQYAKRRALVKAIGMSLKGLDDKNANAVEVDIANADKMMAAKPQKFTDAMKLLQDVDNILRPGFQAKVNVIRNALNTIKAFDADVQSFLSQEITDGTKVVADLDAALAANEWSQVIMLWRTGWDVLGGAERYGQRRKAYNTQRTTTLADIAAVKGVPAVAPRGTALDGMLAEADGLAAHDTLKIEAGVKKLQEISTLCAALQKVAPTVADYGNVRTGVDTDFAALSSGPAAAQLAEPLKAIRTSLALATAAADTAGSLAGDPTSHWDVALKSVQRARADLDTAKTLAANLGPALAAEKAAKGDATAIKQALDALRADATAAASAAHADQVKAELDECTKQIDLADKALTAKNTAGAGKALAAAGKALAAARAIQAAHGQFVTDLAAAEKQLAELRALKTAKAITARIDAVAGAIAIAKEHDAKHEAKDAIASLRAAVDAVAAARQADTDRQAHETLAKTVTGRLGEVTDAGMKKTLAAEIEKAGASADALDFANATKALKATLVRIDEVKLKAGMAKKPPDPKLRDIVKGMMANGGAATVDSAIQNAPADSPKVLTELASARYGKEFSYEDSNPGVNQVTSLKRCCEVFATIPEDLTSNPSIKDVSHADAVNSAGGGYTGSTAHIGMVGRVGIKQKFGTDEEHYDPKSKTRVKSLPADIDENCKPGKAGDEEYLGFAAAHEVGHGVDDLRGFMNKNGTGEAYGGWIEYGGNVQAIADAVGPHIAGKHAGTSFNTSAESKKYMLDKLMSRPAERPPSATPGQAGYLKADFDAFDAFDKWHALATANDVYRRQGDCDAITIGTRIYHEAYPRKWVSYLAAARKKGLTGYQFRAPAEWFAELYAGWKTGRLGDKHPALDWLKKL